MSREEESLGWASRIWKPDRSGKGRATAIRSQGTKRRISEDRRLQGFPPSGFIPALRGGDSPSTGVSFEPNLRSHFENRREYRLGVGRRQESPEEGQG